MRIKRIMSNTTTQDPEKARAFYGDILGLDLLMDHGWFQTFGGDEMMRVQIGFGSEGGAGTPVPDLSIEVDDLEEALGGLNRQAFPSNMGRSWNLGECSAFMCETRSANSLTFFSTSDPAFRQRITPFAPGCATIACCFRRKLRARQQTNPA